MTPVENEPAADYRPCLVLAHPRPGLRGRRPAASAGWAGTCIRRPAAREARRLARMMGAELTPGRGPGRRERLAGVLPS